MNQDLLRKSVLVFGLVYYELGIATVLKDRRLMFVTENKRDTRDDIIRRYTHSELIRFRNRLELSIVSLTMAGKQGTLLPI